MTYEKAKLAGALIASSNGCELFQVPVGKMYNYFMHSPKTGQHSILAQTSIVEDTQTAERVRIHWKGFLADQGNS